MIAASAISFIERTLAAVAAVAAPENFKNCRLVYLDMPSCCADIVGISIIGSPHILGYILQGRLNGEDFSANH